MTIADEARDNALPCEMVKYALRQTKEGIVVSFVVHPNDIPAALQVSHIGSRWMAALVQIGEDELPVKQPAKEAMPDNRFIPQQPDTRPRQENDKPVGAKEKREWNELQAPQQAGIRAHDPRFWAFLREEKGHPAVNEERAATTIRIICGVHSRTEFGTNPHKRAEWVKLDAEYQAWLANANGLVA